jgi:serine O-acetyltransferase
MSELREILGEDLYRNRTTMERLVVLTYRFRHWGRTRSPRLPWRLLGLALAPWEFLLRLGFSGQVSSECVIGRRIRFGHVWGIVIHPSVVVGENCSIYHQVTLGVNEHRHPITGPRIGDRVDIGAGAKVIGAVTVGDDCVIGANAVVVTDVPPNHVAVGVPAVCKPRRDRSLEGSRPVSEPERKQG